MKKLAFSVAASLALPLSALAAVTQSVTSLNGIFTFIKDVLNTALPLIIAAAVVYFIWGLFQLFLASDEEKKDKAKSTILYGIIALFVMVSVWGLVNILVNTFGLQNGGPQNTTNPLQSVPNYGSV